MCQSHFEIRRDLHVIRKCRKYGKCFCFQRAWACCSSFRRWLINLLVLNFSYSILKLFFFHSFWFLEVIPVWLKSPPCRFFFFFFSFSLPYLWVSLPSLHRRSLLLSSFLSADLSFQECQRTFFFSLPCPVSVCWRVKKKHGNTRVKYSLWFRGSMLCNWSFWLDIGETGTRINCLPWWGNTRKKNIKGFFEVKGCLLGNNGKLYSTPPQTHTVHIYIVSGSISSGRYDCSGFPRDDFCSYKVRCFHLGPGQPIWKSSGQNGPRDTMGVPEVLPHSAQFRTLPSLIPLEEKWGGGWNCVHVESREEEKMYVRVWAMH